MKKILFLLILPAALQAQVTQGFESGSRNAERANCWQFMGTNINGGSNAIVGSFAARSGQMSSLSSKHKVISPWVEFNGTGNVTFQHKLSAYNGTSKFMDLVLIDASLNETVVATYDYANGHTLVSGSYPVTWTGTYQIGWYFYGDGGNSRASLDEITLPGTYASDPSDNPGGAGACGILQLIADADGDGVADADDEYPNDPNLAYNIYYPGSAGTFGTLAFEDLWPAKGDYDFNDLVVDYQLKMPISASGDLSEVQVNITVRAMSGYHKGFGLQILGLDGSNVASFTGNQISAGSSLSFAANGLESGQTHPTMILFDNTNSLLTWPGGASYFNTDPADPGGTAVSFTSTLSLNNSMNVNTFIATTVLNPFMFAVQERGREIHLPGAPPTDLVNAAYFGTVDDDTNPGSQKFYQTSNNLPWALNLPLTFDYPVEKADMLQAYLRFATWAQSGGVSAADWYLDDPGNRDDQKIY